jgi:hypothetical protein
MVRERSVQIVREYLIRDIFKKQFLKDEEYTQALDQGGRIRLL